VELLETRLAPANVDILSSHYDVNGQGQVDQFLQAQNLQETTLTPANVNATNFGTLASLPIVGQAYGQPLYRHGLMIGGTPHDVAFVATEHDQVYAFDIITNAATGVVTLSQLWHNSYIDPANGITTTPYAELSTPDIFPEIGITGTGVIDAGTNTLYEVVKTREVRADGGIHYVQKLHALDLATGHENFGGPYQIGDTHVATPGGTPGFGDETTAIVVPGSGAESSGGATPMIPFSAEKESDRMSMQLVGNIVYVAYASHADFRPYHGWVIGFDKTTLQPTKVFNTGPNTDGVGIWESGGGLSFDTDGRYMYFAVGNGFQFGSFSQFDPAHGNYSESVLKIDTTGPNWDPSHPQNTMAVADYFTPFNWPALDSQDADLGSGGVMLLPDSVGSDAHRHLLVETGKQGKIYLLDRGNLGQNSPDQATENTRVVQEVTAGETGVWGNPAFFQTGPNSGIIYYHGSNSVLKGYRITNGHIDDTPTTDILTSTFNSIFPGTQPSVSADGTADPLNPVNGIVWELQVDNAIGRIQGGADNTTAGPATLRAFAANPTTSTFTELYDSTQTGQRDLSTGSVKFTVAVVTNGHVLVDGADHFAVFGLFPAATALPVAPSNLVGQGQSTTTGPQILLTWTNPDPNPGHDPTGIKIFRSTDGTTFTPLNTVNRNATSFTDPGPFQFGQQVFYKLAATNQLGDSPGFSNTVSVIAPLPSAVLAVTGVGASAINLSWSSVANDHFVIERSQNGGAFAPVATLPASQPAYTDTGLAPGFYDYRIHAFNVSPDADSFSNVQGAQVGSMIDHSTPATGGFTHTTDLTTNGSAFITTNLLELTNAPVQAGSAFSNTRITDANFTSTFDVRLHEGTQPDYADGFTFIIQANNPTALGSPAAGIGYQGIGHSVAVVFSTFQHSGDPSNSSVGLALNGAAPVNPVSTIPSGMLLNSQNIKHIELTYDGTTLTVRAEDILTHQVFTTSFTVNIGQVLGSDTAYVGFTGGSGSGPPPPNGFWELEDVLSWNYTSQAPLPGAPTNLRVAAFATSEIDLAWNANSFNETSFQVERSPDGATFTPIATTTVPSYRDVGLGSGTYYYRVRAVNGAGNSPYSNTSLPTVLPASVPPVLTLHQDIGTAGDPSVPGNATFSNGVYSLTASGSDIWGTADHMQYLYQPLSGDGTIVARITNIQFVAGSDFAKAGVMFRESLDANARNAYMMQFPLAPGSRPGWPTYQWRSDTGGSTQDHEFQTPTPYIWVRLVRSGTTFTGSWAMDVSGTPGTWNQLGAETVAMGSNVFVGLAVTSHQNGTVVSASFDHVQILPPSPVTSHIDVNPAAGFVNPNTPFNVTVRALDAFNNVATGYRGTVHFTSSDPMAVFVNPGSGQLPGGNYTFTAADNGVHTFAVTLQALDRQTVTVTDTTYPTVLGGTAVTVTTATVPSSFLVAGFPTTIVAGNPGNFTVTTQDTSHNPVPGYRGTIHFTSTDPIVTFADAVTGLPLPGNNYTFTAGDNGVHNFRATFNTAGTQSITVTDSTIPASGTQTGIQVVAPPAITAVNRSFALNERNALIVSGTFADPTAGQTHQVVVSWGDGSGNSTVNLAVGVFVFGATHTYLEEGSFPIRVTVTAPADGGSDSVSLLASPVVVSRWTFDGSSQPPIAADIAGANPGTVNGGVTSAPGRVGNAFSFDGNPNRGSFVEIPDSASTHSTTGTWAFWVKSTQTSGFVGLVGKSDAGGSVNGITMQMDQGRPRVEVKGPGPTLLLNPSTPLLNNGQYHHMALTFQSGGTTILYIDGLEAARGTAPTFSFGANDPLRFGVMTDGFWAPFNGQLDGVQIYNQVLSPADIQSLANALPVGTIAPPAGLVNWWTGDGTNPTTAADIAGTSAGTLNGGVTSAIGQVGNAFGFNGSSFVNVPDAPSLDSTTGTWNFWMKTTQANTFVGLVGKHDAASSVNGITMQMDSGHARVEVKSGNQTLLLTGSTTLNDNQWHNMALSFQSGGTVILYIDGRMETSGTAPTFNFTASPLRFGRMLDTFWTGYNGLLDEVQIYNRVLSPAEIQSIVNAGSAGLAKGIRVNDPAVLPTGGFTLTAVAGVSTGTQTVATFTDPAGAEALVDYSASINWGDNTPPSAGTITLNSGVFTVQGSHVYTLAGTRPITVTLQHDTAPAATAISTAQITPAAVSILVVSGFPTATTSGAVGTFTVVAKDTFGNIATNYRGMVTFSSSDALAELPDDYTFSAADNGTHSFGGVLKSIGIQSITANDTAQPTVTGTQANILVNPRAFTVTDFPTEVTAGDENSFTVTALDYAGNVASAYTGTVHFTSTDPHAQLPGDYMFTADDAGVHTFTATLVTAGIRSITVTDPLTPTRSTGTESGIQVDPAAVNQFILAGFPSSTQAGVPHNLTVTALDAYGNVATGYGGTVTVSSNDPRLAPFDYTFDPASDAGVHTFSITLTTAGTRSITVADNDNGVQATQDRIQVTPGVAVSFMIVVLGDVVAGTPVNVYVTAVDAYGNTGAIYTGTVHLSSDDFDGFDYTFGPGERGTHVFSVTFRTPGTHFIRVQDTLDPNLFGEQDDIPVA
jgi:hypothetical protein